jgi:TolA-binding protein
MQPLKFRSNPDSPIEFDAIELLRSVERFVPPQGQKQRVRLRILERSVSRPVSVLKPVLIAGLVLGAAVASAAFARHLHSSKQHASQVSQVTHPQTQLPSVLNNARSLPVATNDSKDSTATTPENSGSPLPTGSSARNDAPLRIESSVRAAQSSEKVLVFDAMHALRREGHPEQAAKLLDEYLRRYPQGSLAEEALALSIEAFTSLGDPKAKNLADRYLILYPNGRFRAAAERARARFAP